MATREPQPALCGPILPATPVPNGFVPSTGCPRHRLIPARLQTLHKWLRSGAIDGSNSPVHPRRIPTARGAHFATSELELPTDSTAWKNQPALRKFPRATVVPVSSQFPNWLRSVKRSLTFCLWRPPPPPLRTSAPGRLEPAGASSPGRPVQTWPGYRRASSAGSDSPECRTAGTTAQGYPEPLEEKWNTGC
jgi:hypothetical protein